MIAEADYGMTEMAFEMERQRPGGPQKGDDSLFVKFFLHPRENHSKSAEEGRPIFEDTEYIEITQPGNRDSVICRPASEMDKARFPRHYAAFKNRQDQPQQGTPLSQWPALTRSQVEELKFFNVHTVEQLASMSDTNAQKFTGLVQLRIQARAYLEEAAGQAASSKLAAELAKRDEEIAALKAQMEAFIKEQQTEKVSVKK
jgi:hypothetical protein